MIQIRDELMVIRYLERERLQSAELNEHNGSFIMKAHSFRLSVEAAAAQRVNEILQSLPFHANTRCQYVISDLENDQNFLLIN